MVPGRSTGFVGQGVLPTPEGATAATSMAGRQGGQTGQVAGVWLWCAHPLRADPVKSGDAQHLNGQGRATNFVFVFVNLKSLTNYRP